MQTSGAPIVDVTPDITHLSIFHLRRDPFERADFNSRVFWKWVMEHVPYLYLAQAVVKQQIDNFVNFLHGRKQHRSILTQ